MCFKPFPKALVRSENKLSLPKFELGLPIPFIAPKTVQLTKCPLHCTKDGSISDKKYRSNHLYPGRFHPRLRCQSLNLIFPWFFVCIRFSSNNFYFFYHQSLIRYSFIFVYTFINYFLSSCFDDSFVTTHAAGIINWLYVVW